MDQADDDIGRDLGWTGFQIGPVCLIGHIRPISYPSYKQRFPELDDLRSEPRFKEMLKRMNLPE